VSVGGDPLEDPEDDDELVLVEGAARSGESTGLGLTISRAIVEAHGGMIWLAESEGGTRVRFSLPRAG